MKKETIIAVSLGILLGIVVAVGMILSTQKKETAKVIPVVQNNITPIATKEMPDAPQLQITSPEDQMITAENTVTIKGKSTKDSLVVIQSAANNKIVKGDKEDFSTDFPLALGENKISISMYAKDGNGTPQEAELTVFYLQEE